MPLIRAEDFELPGHRARGFGAAYRVGIFDFVENFDSVSWSRSQIDESEAIGTCKEIVRGGHCDRLNVFDPCALDSRDSSNSLDAKVISCLEGQLRLII